MATLTGQTIASSYEQLLHCDADGGLTTSLQAIKDGDNGITSALKLARDKVEVLPSGADSTTAFEVSQNDGTAILTVNSSSPTVTITGDGVVTDDLTLNSDASVLTFGAGSDVTFTHDDGTGMNVASAGDFDIAVSAGNGTFTVADGQTLTLGQSGASAILLSPHGTPGSELASLINTAGTTDGTDAAGSILLSAVAGGMSLAWADGKDLWAEGGRFVVTANEDAADCIKLHADAGTSQAIQIVNDAGTTDGSDDAGAIELSAAAGGIGLAWADGKDLWAEGGRFVVTANEDAADCIKLHADAGTSQAITLLNDAGTGAAEGSAAIQLLASAGGVNIKGNVDAANAVLLTADGGTSATMVVHNDQGSVDGTAGAGSILLVSDAGGMGLSWHDGKDLWAEGGRAIITANEDAADCIKLHADAGTSQTILIQNDAGTGVSAATEVDAAIQLSASAGGIGLYSALNAANAIRLEANAGTSETIILHSNLGSGATSINLVSDAGGITLAPLSTVGVTVGVDGTGADIRAYSSTSSEGLFYDASQDELGLLLTTKLKFHDIGGGEEIYASSNGHLEINSGTTLDMTAPTIDLNASSAITLDGDITVGGTSKLYFYDAGTEYIVADASNNITLYAGAVMNVKPQTHFQIYQDGGSTHKATWGGEIDISGKFVPISDNAYDFGKDGKAWKDIYYEGSLVDQSDERVKENIEDCDLGLDFINALQPRKYNKIADREQIATTRQFADNDAGYIDEEELVTQEDYDPERKRYGIIAQEVIEVLESLDKEGKFWGIDESNPDKYHADYISFIAPLMKAVQELSAKVTALENA